jgi:hypothetical protein
MSYKKGQSGNPNGRPRGISDKRDRLRRLLEPHAPSLVAKAVRLALRGDTAALRICLDRLIPPLKARDGVVSLESALAGSLREQGEKILQALAEGRLTPDETTSLMQALAAQARIVEFSELEQRIAQLEESLHDPLKKIPNDGR